MPRKKKKPFNRLPNGFGSIKKLSGNRRKPYQALAPSKIVNGVVFPGEPLGYFEKWEDAYERLALYRANKEWEQKKKAEKLYTFAEVYQMYWRNKYELALKPPGKASQNSTRAAFKNTAALHDKIFADITCEELQNVLNEMAAPTTPGKKPLKFSSLELVKSLYSGMYKYALGAHIVTADTQASVSIPIEDDDQSGIPFSLEELDVLYNHLDDYVVQAIVIMCYSGWRIREFLTMKTDLNNMTFFGGVKTKAGKRRTVPIHTDLTALVAEYMKHPFTCTPDSFRKKWDEVLGNLGILWTGPVDSNEAPIKHTPHDCRHTFSWICDKYKVDPISKRIMIGHKLGEDVTDNVYGHRTLDELRTEIQKIEVPDCVTNL